MAARRFCLDLIKQVYGFDHRPDWHEDLDRLLGDAEGNHYSRLNAGAFWTLSTRDGTLVATAGIRHLGWKPGIPALFPGRWADPTEIGSLCRVYIRSEWRRAGLGTWLAALAERAAVQLGYPTLYLHAGTDAPHSLAFWNAAGYRSFGTCDTSTHFEKQLATATAIRSAA